MRLAHKGRLMLLRTDGAYCSRRCGRRATAQDVGRWRPQPSAYDLPHYDDLGDDEPVLVHLRGVRRERLREVGQWRRGRIDLRFGIGGVRAEEGACRRRMAVLARRIFDHAPH